MNLTLSKIAILLLLPAFLLASVGSALGYTWCLKKGANLRLTLLANNDLSAGSAIIQTSLFTSRKHLLFMQRRITSPA